MDYYQKLEQSYATGNKISAVEQEVIRNSDTHYISEEEVLRMCRRTKGRIKKMVAPDTSEKSILVKVERGENFFYNVYLYKFSEETTITEMEQALNRLYEEIPFLQTLFYEYEPDKYVKMVTKKDSYALTIQDISLREKTEKNQILDNFIAGKRQKKYEPDQNFPIHINIFKTDDEEFLCVLSMCEQLECGANRDKIINALFRECEYQPLKLDKEENKASWVNTMTYWQEVFPQKPQNIFSEENSQKSDMETEILALDNELVEQLQELARDYNIELKTIFTTVWGVMLCKYLKQSEVVLGDVHVGGKLNLAPVKVTKDNNIFKIMQNVQNQLEQVHKNDLCTLKEIETKIGFESSKCMPVVQSFSERKDITYVMETMIEGKVYQVLPLDMPKIPLFISYNMISVVMRVKYYHDKALFKNTDVENLHENFQRVLRSMLNAMRGINPSEGIEDTDKAKAADKMKDTAQKALYLKNSGIFGSLMLEQLLKLAEQCRIVYAQMGEDVVSAQTEVTGLYMIGEGKVEVSRVDGSHYVKTLQMLKAGDVFGIESMLKNNISENSYSAYGEIVKLVEIPIGVLKEEIKRHPEILQELLELQSKQTSKFERLWIMN